MILDTVATQPAEAGSLEGVREILRRHEHDRGGLIAILEAVQARYGHLSEAALRTIAERTGRPLVDVYGVATFYRFFTLKPRGKHLICACQGTACHVRGAPRVVEELEQQLGIRRSETTDDKQFTLETVNCLGACALGPVVVIDGRYFSKVRRSGVRQMLDDAAKGFAGGGSREVDRGFPIEVTCPRCNRGLMDAAVPIDGLPSIRLTMSLAGRHGRLRLSSLYGSDHARSEPEVPEGQAPAVFCPHCHGPLDTGPDCPDCQGRMVLLLVRGGGALRICSRRGCRNRTLDLM
jgi:NADH-quinone oxidoreductase subunit E